MYYKFQPRYAKNKHVADKRMLNLRVREVCFDHPSNILRVAQIKSCINLENSIEIINNIKIWGNNKNSEATKSPTICNQQEAYKPKHEPTDDSQHH